MFCPSEGISIARTSFATREKCNDTEIICPSPPAVRGPIALRRTFFRIKAPAFADEPTPTRPPDPRSYGRNQFAYLARVNLVVELGTAVISVCLASRGRRSPRSVDRAPLPSPPLPPVSLKLIRGMRVRAGLMEFARGGLLPVPVIAWARAICGIFAGA